MIRYIKHKDVDTAKWDECIKKAVNSLPYAFSWYLDIVVEHWDALILNDYEAVFPLPSKQKFYIKYSFTPFWVQQLGLFSQTCEGLKRIEDFVRLIPKEFRFVELNLNFSALLKHNRGFHLKENTNLLVNLNKSYSDHHLSYSKNLKRNLKKAYSNNLQLFKNDSPNTLVQLFRADKGAEMSHFSEADYKNIETIMHVAVHKHCGQVWMAYDEGNRALAGMFLLFGPKRIILLFTGNSKAGKECAAMPFLIDEFIKENANSSLTFDFEGSNNENLARFYKSFGAVDQPYQSLKINRLPLLFRFLK